MQKVRGSIIACDLYVYIKMIGFRTGEAMSYFYVPGISPEKGDN